MTETGTLPSLLTLAPRGEARAVALVTHGGRARSTAPSSWASRPALRMYPFTFGLRRGGRRAGLAVAQLRYRVAGYNDGDPVHDVRWAVDRLREQFGEVPVCLVGHSMGGRACLRAADAPGVVSVAALAPWLPPAEPVAQVAARTVMLVHGDGDRVTDPAGSLAWMLQAQGVAGRMCRFEVRGAGHAMLQRPSLWTSLVRRFALGTLGLAPLDGELESALSSPAAAAARISL